MKPWQWYLKLILLSRGLIMMSQKQQRRLVDMYIRPWILHAMKLSIYGWLDHPTEDSRYGMYMLIYTSKLTTFYISHAWFFHIYSIY